jgi:hypothetical protein
MNDTREQKSSEGSAIELSAVNMTCVKLEKLLPN